jgi:hypothetical protein
MPDDGTAGRLGLRIEAEFHAQVSDDLHMLLGVIEVFLPLFLELFVTHAAKRGAVDLHPPSRSATPG